MSEKKLTAPDEKSRLRAAEGKFHRENDASRLTPETAKEFYEAALEAFNKNESSVVECESHLLQIATARTDSKHYKGPKKKYEDLTKFVSKVAASLGGVSSGDVSPLDVHYLMARNGFNENTKAGAVAAFITSAQTALQKGILSPEVVQRDVDAFARIDLIDASAKEMREKLFNHQSSIFERKNVILPTSQENTFKMK